MGAGKSETLRAFARKGAAVVSSDEIVHQLLREDAEVVAAIRERWGDRVFGPNGEIDRARVAGIVFSDSHELAWLEGLLHPRVAARYLARREELARLKEPPALFVVEVPLLYESGSDSRFDAVVVVTASPDVRRARGGGTGEERERRLIPDEVKVASADFAYVNDGTLEELDAFVSDVVARLSRLRRESLRGE